VALDADASLTDKASEPGLHPIAEGGSTMSEKKTNETQPRDADKTTATGLPAGNATTDPNKPSADGKPKVRPIAVDVVGKIPDDIRIDPDITEGHPGYSESGDSEIIPLERIVEDAETEKNDKSD
jgi:hypothetical protein